MTNRYNKSISIVSFLVNTVTFSFTSKALLFLVVLLFLSCSTPRSTQEIVWCKIISEPMYTMKGYKYYIIHDGKFDSCYLSSNKYELNKWYPFAPQGKR